MREQVAQLLVFYEMGDYRLATSPSGFSIGKFKISVKTCNMFDCYLTLLDFFLKSREKNSLILLLSASNVTLNSHRQSVLVIDYSITVNTQHKSPEKPWQRLSTPSVRVLREFRSCTGQHRDGIFSNASMV